MALWELDGHKVVTPPEDRYFVASNATVIGRVTLGEDVSVWFNAVIRGDSVQVDLVRVARHFQLTERQFHWLSEYNR